MKKIIVFVLASVITNTALAQMRGGDDYFDQKVDMNFNFSTGAALGTSVGYSSAIYNYTELINPVKGTTTMKCNNSYSVDMTGGFFIGKKGHFGIGTGIIYAAQQGNLSLSQFHVEYQSFDQNGNTFRQLVTATGPVNELLDIKTMSIPLMLKYKTSITKKIGFMLDAGILYNVSAAASYQTNASFNYEAIYAISTGDKGPYTYFDDAQKPSVYDWFITIDQFTKHSSHQLASEFDSLRAQGYNIGLGLKPKNDIGTVKFTSGSVGFILRPSLSILLHDRLRLNIGAYYNYQSYNNNTVSSYKLIDKMGGEYTSVLSTVKNVAVQSAGLTVGLNYFFGKPNDIEPENSFFMSLN